MRMMFLLFFVFAAQVNAADKTPIFSIDGKTATYEEVYNANKAKMHELEQQRYDQFRQIAYDSYLTKYWKDMAKKKRKSVAVVKESYLNRKAKVKNADLKKAYESLKNHPSLASKSDKEKKAEIKNYLTTQAKAELQRDIISEAEKKGKIKVLYPKPRDLVFDIAANADDIYRYGPAATDTKPTSCKGEQCVTIYEYGEFQCPACIAAYPQTHEVLKQYKGKIRWAMRDFPLSFHDRAKPSAIAARCAGEQNKYWQAYDFFFTQKKLSDDDFQDFAKKEKLNVKDFNKCLKSNKKIVATVDRNYQQGQDLGVTGTPTFFVNGRKLGGITQFAKFKQVIDEELAKKKKK